LYCSGLSFPDPKGGEIRGGNGQLEGLSNHLIPLNNSGLSWFNCKLGSIPHRAAKLSLHQHVDLHIRVLSFTSWNQRCSTNLSSVVLYDNWTTSTKQSTLKMFLHILFIIVLIYNSLPPRGAPYTLGTSGLLVVLLAYNEPSAIPIPPNSFDTVFMHKRCVSPGISGCINYAYRKLYHNNKLGNVRMA
jgi:hypothetical protein